MKEVKGAETVHAIVGEFIQIIPWFPSTANINIVFKTQCLGRLGAVYNQVHPQYVYYRIILSVYMRWLEWFFQRAHYAVKSFPFWQY